MSISENGEQSMSIVKKGLMKQGAEARLYYGEYCGIKTVIKERFVKKYRHPALNDRLTKERLKAELRGILRCKQIGLKTPTIFFVESGSDTVHMEYLEGTETVNLHIGKLLQNCAQADNASNSDELKLLAQEIGVTVAKMHMTGIIHGDLTTSNILVETNCTDASGKYKPKLALIDFGLSHVDNSTEDKGVDLYVLERAITSTFSNIPWFFDLITSSYRAIYSKAGDEVYKKLEEIRLRGRKRTMVG